ncbi:MAG: hypothetical protein K0V04_11365 [Deltaproteobacteria bacterium]|nr:hypothetical protein [Deltaproteobacteria bacterium]
MSLLRGPSGASVLPRAPAWATPKTAIRVRGLMKIERGVPGEPRARPCDCIEADDVGLLSGERVPSPTLREGHHGEIQGSGWPVLD